MSSVWLFAVSMLGIGIAMLLPNDKAGLRGGFFRALGTKLAEVCKASAAVSGIYLLSAIVLYVTVHQGWFTIASLRTLDDAFRAWSHYLLDMLPPSWLFAIIFVAVFIANLSVDCLLNQRLPGTIRLAGPRAGAGKRRVISTLAKGAIARIFRILVAGRRILDVVLVALAIATSSTYLTGTSSTLAGIPFAALTKAQEGVAQLAEEVEETAVSVASADLLEKSLDHIGASGRTAIRAIFEALSALEDQPDLPPVYANLSSAYQPPRGLVNSRGPSGPDRRGPSGGGPSGGGPSGGGPSDGGPSDGGPSDRGPSGDERVRKGPIPGYLETPEERFEHLYGARVGTLTPNELRQRVKWLVSARSDRNVSGPHASSLSNQVRKAAIGAISQILLDPHNLTSVREAVGSNPVLSLIIDIAATAVQEPTSEVLDQAYRHVASAVTRDGARKADMLEDIYSFTSTASFSSGAVSGEQLAIIRANVATAEKIRDQVRPPVPPRESPHFSSSLPSNFPWTEKMEGSGLQSLRCPVGTVRCMCTSGRSLGCLPPSACIPGTPCR